MEWTPTIKTSRITWCIFRETIHFEQQCLQCFARCDFRHVHAGEKLIRLLQSGIRPEAKLGLVGKGQGDTTTHLYTKHTYKENKNHKYLQVVTVKERQIEDQWWIYAKDQDYWAISAGFSAIYCRSCRAGKYPMGPTLWALLQMVCSYRWIWVLVTCRKAC